MSFECMGLDLWQARPPGPLIVSHARVNPAPNHCLASGSRLQALKRVAQWKKKTTQVCHLKKTIVISFMLETEEVFKKQLMMLKDIEVI